MYKKLITLLSVPVMVLSLAACGKDAAPVTTVPSTQLVETMPEPAIPETTVPEFTPIVLAEDENCTVIITGIEEDSLFGYALNVFLENKTETELMYTVDNVSVNGYMCDPFWATTVAPGKKANTQITFMDSDFEINGITEVQEITLTLQVYDNNDWMAPYLVEALFTINP